MHGEKRSRACLVEANLIGRRLAGDACGNMEPADGKGQEPATYIADVAA